MKKSKTSRLEHCWNELQHLEESYRLGEICCYSASSEKKKTLIVWKIRNESDYEPQDDNERKWNIYEYFDLAREQEKVVEHKSVGDDNCSWCAWNSPSICRVPHVHTNMTQGSLLWNQAQDRSLYTPGGSKNVLSPASSPKKGSLISQAINLAPPEWVIAWADSP